MPMYNVIEYSDNYPKTSGSLWEYLRDKSALNDDGDTVLVRALHLKDTQGIFFPTVETKDNVMIDEQNFLISQ